MGRSKEGEGGGKKGKPRRLLLWRRVSTFSSGEELSGDFLPKHCVRCDASWWRKDLSVSFDCDSLSEE